MRRSSAASCVSISLRPLRSAPDAGLSAATTASERMALVETLTLEAWTLAGQGLPSYARADLPVRKRAPDI